MTTETTAQAESRPQRKGPFRLTGEGWPYLLVPLIPAAVVLEFMHAGATWVFLASTGWPSSRPRR